MAGSRFSLADKHPSWKSHCCQLTERFLCLQTVITADVVNFDTRQKFDRVVSIEMFEHMKNYQVFLLIAVSTIGGFLP
jgi:cyclopropane-fatty-acyl-phospholipid synthase